VSQIRIGGGCLCGAVRYACTGEAVRFYHRHCGRCRKASGTGHATNLMLKPGEVSWLQGEVLRARQCAGVHLSSGRSGRYHGQGR